MHSKTRSLIRDIRTKVKSPITGTSQFASDDAVIALAILRFYESLKQQRII